MIDSNEEDYLCACVNFYLLILSPPLDVDPQIEMRKQQRMMERANEFNAKYQKTIESSTSADNFANKKVSTCDGNK